MREPLGFEPARGSPGQVEGRGAKSLAGDRQQARALVQPGDRRTATDQPRGVRPGAAAGVQYGLTGDVPEQGQRRRAKAS
jgi:hypothetical protein